MTGEEIIRSPGADRRYRMCFCIVCKTSQRCTPENDFYDAIPKALICSGCYRQQLEARGFTVDDPMI